MPSASKYFSTRHIHSWYFQSLALEAVSIWFFIDKLESKWKVMKGKESFDFDTAALVSAILLGHYKGHCKQH